ncbi:MAG: PadR family transcriptional regulator [Bacteroidales bacterium]
MNSENAKAQMRKGTLEFCILAIVSKQDCYASDIIETMKKKNLIVVEGTLYPLLTRQKNAGLLQYRWEESRQGPPRKYYALTDKGRTYLSEMEYSWKEMVDSVNSIITKK